MEILKINRTAALCVLTAVLLIAALYGVPFAGLATIISFLVLGVSATLTKEDVRMHAQKFGTVFGAVVKRHRILVILAGVYLLAWTLKQSGVEVDVSLIVAIRYLVPWRRISHSLGLNTKKTKSIEKIDAK